MCEALEKAFREKLSNMPTEVTFPLTWKVCGVVAPYWIIFLKICACAFWQYFTKYSMDKIDPPLEITASSFSYWPSKGRNFLPFKKDRILCLKKLSNYCRPHLLSNTKIFYWLWSTKLSIVIYNARSGVEI